MEDSYEAVSQKMVTVSLIFDREPPITRNINSNLSVSQFRLFLEDNFKISKDNAYILIDGLLAEEDTILKSMMIDSNPCIHVIHESKLRKFTLYFQNYSYIAEFPINIQISTVLHGFNSYLIRYYGDMISTSDIIVSYRGVNYSLDTYISSFYDKRHKDLLFYYPENMAVSPYIQKFASERCSAFSLEQELDQANFDMEKILSINAKLENENQMLRQQLQQDEGFHVLEKCKELEAQNEVLIAQVSELTDQLSELERTMGTRDSLMVEWQREKEELEIENITLQNQMEELSLRCKEDQSRLDLLHDECKSLCDRLNESMESMQKYEHGYKNVKKRMDGNDRTKVIVNEVEGLSSASLSYHLYMGQNDNMSADQELLQLKNDIMENIAYHIMVLQLSGAILTDQAIDMLFQIIMEGVFPRLRVIDLFSCKLERSGIQRLYYWSQCFPFIDVLSPEIIQLKVNENSYEKLARCIVGDATTNIQHMDIRSCNLGDNGVIVLCEMISHGYLPYLHTLLIDNNQITDVGMYALSVVLTPTTMKSTLISFSCASNPLTIEGIKALAIIISQNTQIQNLWVGGIGMDDAGLEVLCKAFVTNNCYSLILLNLPNNQITDQGMKKFSMLFEFNLFQIKDFGLATNPIGDEGLLQLLEAMNGKKCLINRLFLRDTQLTEVSMQSMKQVLIQKDLSFTELGLTNNRIGNRGFDCLVEGLIQGNVPIRKLWLFDTGLTNDSDTSFKKLIASHLFENLLLLDLANNELDDTALASIVAAILDNNKPLQLEELWLGGCSLMDTGAVLIMSLIQNGYLPNLQTLCMDLCGLTDDAVKQLALVIKSMYSSMEELNLAGNMVSEEVKIGIQLELEDIVKELNV